MSSATPVAVSHVYVQTSHSRSIGHWNPCFGKVNATQANWQEADLAFAFQMSTLCLLTGEVASRAG